MHNTCTSSCMCMQANIVGAKSDRGTGMVLLTKNLKVYGILGSILQCFLNVGNICHIYFRDMGYFSK